MLRKLGFKSAKSPTKNLRHKNSFEESNPTTTSLLLMHPILVQVVQNLEPVDVARLQRSCKTILDSPIFEPYWEQLCQNTINYKRQVLLDISANFPWRTAYPFMHSSPGQYPMHGAASAGSIEIAKFLITKYSHKVDEKDQLGKTPLYHAALAGNHKTVEFLLSKGAKIEMGRSGESGVYAGYSPLGISAVNGHAKVVKVLLGKGAKVLEAAPDNMIPHIVSSNYVEVAKLLMPKVKKSDLEYIGFESSISKENWEMVAVIEKYAAASIDPEESSIASAAVGNLDRLKKYLSMQKPAPKKSVLGRCLIEATKKDREETVLYILTQGVDVCFVDNTGNTALNYAAHKGYEHLIESMLAHCHGAVNVNFRDGLFVRKHALG